MNSPGRKIDAIAGPTVFVVEDNAPMREAIGSLLRSVGLRTVMFSSAKDFLQIKRPNSPECLVLDVRLPGLSGLELQRVLAAARDEIPIIFITSHGDIRMSVRAMKAGAIEFLPKPFHEQDLLDAIHEAIRLDSAVRKQLSAAADLHSRYGTLTPREREVMARVVGGFANKQIAAELGTSELTVKIQRRQVMRKMQAKSLPELVRMSEPL